MQLQLEKSFPLCGVFLVAPLIDEEDSGKRKKERKREENKKKKREVRDVVCVCVCVSVVKTLVPHKSSVHSTLSNHPSRPTIKLISLSIRQECHCDGFSIK